ncbi:MAG: ABC transporter permease [Bacteroidales bacterium]|nr:ABC transporter permease [Bacteroidales bacterium]
MFDRDKWQEIYSSLKSNKLRTFFTAFGVFWGIFMLIIMLGSGNGLRNAVYEGMGDFATNSAIMFTRQTTMPYKGFPRGREWLFHTSDMEALIKNIPEIDQLAPRLQPWGGNGGNNVVHGLKTGAYNITGDYPAINKIDPVRLLKGRFLNEIDLQNKRKVAVIGNRVHDELFKITDPVIGEYIRINGVYYQVVGVFEPKNKNINIGGEKDKSIFIPFTTMQVSYNLGDDVHYFLVTAKPNKSASVVEEKCMKLLAERNHVAPEDEQAFGHFNLEKEFKKMNGLFLGIRVLIWIVGTGTLLAGVIGVSNIMLIIIKERTKEIGIQRAIGATPWRIMSQIITESVTLTAVAGSFGLVLGVFLLEMINNMLASSAEKSEMFRNPEVDIQVAVTALIVLIISGVVAGLIPARKAVSMKPVDALRYE